MTNEEFEKRDQEFEKAFKPLREQKVPSHILENFSVSVEQAILKKQAQEEGGRNWFRAWFPVIIPALGVLLLFITVHFSEEPSPKPVHPPLSASSILPLAVSMADLSAEIAALEELGVWSEEDDAAVDESLVGL